MANKSTAGKIWDLSDYEVRAEMLSQHYQSDYSIRKYVGRTWKFLPKTFKAHMIKRYR